MATLNRTHQFKRNLFLSTKTIRKLPTNKIGKDCVVGDLHGCCELLERVLDAVSFDNSKDR